ncbi:MAG TPA: PocR ligand-binding domain-containing protein [Clostridia bacterium]|nr:PocR ligand-binding domain-containing protein [Clostridia bacterium]
MSAEVGWTLGAFVLAAMVGSLLVLRHRKYQLTLRNAETQKREEESLRHSAERFRAFTAASFEGICVHDQGLILDANDQFLALFGYERAELIGAQGLSLVAPDSKMKVAVMVRAGSEELYEHEALRKDGTTFIAETQGKPILWEGKKARVTALRDITERKRLENALQKRILALTQPLDSSVEISFTDLFNLEEIQKVQDAFAKVAGVASIITRPDGVPLTKPSNFCRLCNSIIRQTETGRKNCFYSDSVIGCHNPKGPTVQRCLSGGLWDAGASITVGGKHIANWLIGQVRNEAQDERQMLEYAKQIGANEEEFRHALQEVPVMSREQFERIAQALFVMANELSLRAYQNSQQARFIAERQRAETERERLLRELVRKNKELESIVYVSSHDLRSPLVNIQGFSHRLQTACDEIQRLLTAPETPPQLQSAVTPILQNRMAPSLNFILTSVLRMDTLLNGLLRLSRLGRNALRIESLDMNRLAQTAVESLTFQTQKLGARVDLNPLPPCYGVAVQISQILSNLLDNALKYHQPDRPIHIRIHGQSQEGQGLYCVEDNGPGIAPEHQEKIWEIFQRLDPSGQVKGEGLGLAIVRRILDRHNGRAWVESEPGVGSRFFFTLPLEPFEPATPLTT